MFDEISEQSIKFSLISKNEINFSFFLKKNQTSVNLNLNNDKSFSLFEFEFIFTNFIITMFNGGREWGFRKIIKDEDFYNNYYLSNFKYKKGKILNTMPIIIKDIHKILKKGSKPISDGLTSLKSQKICDLILENRLSHNLFYIVNVMNLNLEYFCKNDLNGVILKDAGSANHIIYLLKNINLKNFCSICSKSS